jgi:hypothetical protein
VASLAVLGDGRIVVGFRLAHRGRGLYRAGACVK